MRILTPSVRLFVVLLAGLSACTQIHAQATRTWISGVGDDVNPCSRTAPCKTFAGAISKTAAGGAIEVLDPGPFGAVTIVKSVTLESVGNIAGVLATGTNGITVNDGGNGIAIVTLRGLSIEGEGLTAGAAGLKGVLFLSGKGLIVDHCTIDNFSASNGAGIAFTPSKPATLLVRDTTLQNDGGVFDPQNPEDLTFQNAAVLIAPVVALGGSAHAVLENVRLTGSQDNGLQVVGPATVVVSNSIISENANHAIWALGVTSDSSNGNVDMTLENVILSGNPLVGVLAEGAGATVRLSNATITGSLQGIRATSTGNIVSFGNNRILGNTVNGTPTTTSPLQ